MVDEHQLHLIK